MGIKRPVCEQCEFIKETKKEKCIHPTERGRRMSFCSGIVDYYPLWKEARDHINQHYKSLR